MVKVKQVIMCHYVEQKLKGYNDVGDSFCLLNCDAEERKGHS